MKISALTIAAAFMAILIGSAVHMQWYGIAAFLFSWTVIFNLEVIANKGGT